MKKKQKEVTEKIYLIVKEDGTEMQITVPDDWKVTFGPAVVPRSSATVSKFGDRMPMALRFYESETRQRAIFTNVVSFRDMSIPVKEKRTRIQEKDGFMEFDGKRKRTTFQAKSYEWVNPDDELLALPEEFEE